MSRSKKNRRQRREGNTFWQSKYLNEARFRMYRQWLWSLAVNRFQWIGLPETCDQRFLEITLATNGIATIAHPHKQPGVFYSTQATQMGPMNVYDNPTRWQSFGNNGWHFDVNNANGVLIWENRLRVPILEQLDLFAAQLAKFDRVLDVNLMQQSTPYLITGPQEQVNAVTQMTKQVTGMEPVIAGYQMLDEIEVKALNTQVPYIGDKLKAGQASVWADVFKFLGIPSLNEKTERLIAAETEVMSQPCNLMALDSIGARREACEKLNSRFGLDVQVVWNEDYISETWNYAHNEREQAKEGGADEA